MCAARLAEGARQAPGLAGSACRSCCRLLPRLHARAARGAEWLEGRPSQRCMRERCMPGRCWMAHLVAVSIAASDGARPANRPALAPPAAWRLSSPRPAGGPGAPLPGGLHMHADEGQGGGKHTAQAGRRGGGLRQGDGELLRKGEQGLVGWLWVGRPVRALQVAGAGLQQGVRLGAPFLQASWPTQPSRSPSAAAIPRALHRLRGMPAVVQGTARHPPASLPGHGHPASLCSPPRPLPVCCRSLQQWCGTWTGALCGAS